jgi:hypothetical protein
MLGAPLATVLVGGQDNLLWLEALIVDRLTTQMPDVTLSNAESLSAASQARLVSPGIVVLYSGSTLGAQNLYTRDVEMSQRWTLVGATREAAEIVPKTQARSVAGSLTARIINAFLGWRPPKTDAPFRLIALPAPVYAGSYLLTPVTFEVPLTFVYNSFTEE